MKKILVLGGTGFIGSSISRYLAGNTENQVVATHFNRTPLQIEKVDWINVNLLDFEKTKVIFNQAYDVIINAAAVTSGANIISSNPETHVTNNVRMNTNIFEAMSLGVNPNLYVFLSCSVMYPDGIIPNQENSPVDYSKIHPKYFGIACTKLFMEQLCKFYSGILNTKFVAIRHSNVYGPNDKFDLDFGHVLSSLIVKTSKSTSFIEVWGDGTEKRDFLYIDDFLDFINKLLISDKLLKFEIFNIGSGSQISVNDLAKTIIKVSGKNLSIQNCLDQRQLKINILIDSSEAQKRFNWIPTTDLLNGIKKTYSWYKEQIY